MYTAVRARRTITSIMNETQEHEVPLLSSCIHCLYAHSSSSTAPGPSPEPRCFFLRLLLLVSHQTPQPATYELQSTNQHSSSSFTGNIIPHLALCRCLHLPIPVDPRAGPFRLRPKAGHTAGAEILPGICPRWSSGPLLGIHT